MPSKDDVIHLIRESFLARLNGGVVYFQEVRVDEDNLPFGKGDADG
jgi:hypothetical protein